MGRRKTPAPGPPLEPERVPAFQVIVGYLRSRHDFEYAAYRSLSPDGAWLTLEDEFGPSGKIRREKILPVEGSAAGEAIRRPGVVRCHDVKAKPAWHEDALDARAGFASRVSVPVILHGRPLGVLEALSAKPNAFSAEDEEALGRISELLGRVVGHEHATLRIAELEQKVAPPGASSRADVGLHTAMRAHILAALEACGGKIYGPDGAAARLGLKADSLRKKLKRIGVNPTRVGGAAGKAKPPAKRPRAAPAAPTQQSPRSPSSSSVQAPQAAPRFNRDDIVRIRPGSTNSEFPGVDFGNWKGVVRESRWHIDRYYYRLRFDGGTRASFPPEYVRQCADQGGDPDQQWVPDDRLERAVGR